MDWLDVARTQDGLITRSELRRCDVADARVRRMIRCAELVRLYPGVYLHASNRPSRRQRLRGALMWSGDVLSHRSAAELWRLGVAPTARVEITCRPSKVLRAPAGVRIHRLVLPAEDRASVAGLAVTGRRRTVLDLLRALTFPDAVALRDTALRQGWLTDDALVAELLAAPQRAGNNQIRRLLRDLEPKTHAESERLLVQILRRGRITGWQAQLAVHADGHRYLVDAGFDRERLALEVEGRRYHDDRSARFESDRVRHNALTNAGWRVLRFTWRRLIDEPAEVEREIRRALGR